MLLKAIMADKVKRWRASDTSLCYISKFESVNSVFVGTKLSTDVNLSSHSTHSSWALQLLFESLFFCDAYKMNGHSSKAFEPILAFRGPCPEQRVISSRLWQPCITQYIDMRHYRKQGIRARVLGIEMIGAGGYMKVNERTSLVCQT